MSKIRKSQTPSSSSTPPKQEPSARGGFADRANNVFQRNIPPFVPNPNPFFLFSKFIIDLLKPSPTEQKKQPSAPPAKTPERPPSLPQSIQGSSAKHINQKAVSTPTSSQFAKKDPSTLPGQLASNSSSASGEQPFLAPVTLKNSPTKQPPLPAKPIPKLSGSVIRAINIFLKERDDRYSEDRIRRVREGLPTLDPEEDFTYVKDHDRDDVAAILSGVSIPEGTDKDLYLMSLLQEAKSFAAGSHEHKMENLMFVGILNKPKEAELSQEAKLSLTRSFKMMEDPLARNRLIHAIASVDQMTLPESKKVMIELEAVLEKTVFPRSNHEIDNVNSFIGNILYPEEDWIGDAVTFLRENEYIGDVPLFFHLAKEYKDESPKTSMADLFKRVLKEN